MHHFHHQCHYQHDHFHLYLHHHQYHDHPYKHQKHQQQLENQHHKYYNHNLQLHNHNNQFFNFSAITLFAISYTLIITICATICITYNVSSCTNSSLIVCITIINKSLNTVVFTNIIFVTELQLRLHYNLFHRQLYHQHHKPHHW